ncbi:hypothetical protein Taro_046759, partial [Colocasia esculenta]|nr:hypothetical protein [Colocasia esculenta]
MSGGGVVGDAAVPLQEPRRIPNVAYYHQNFADGGFSWSQVEAVVKQLLESGHGKQPLVILHNKRIVGLMENDSNRQLIKEWKAQDSLYATANGPIMTGMDLNKQTIACNGSVL